MHVIGLKAQTNNLSEMDSLQRSEYLIQKAKEVTLVFGPEFYKRKKTIPKISVPKVFDDKRDPKYVGRRYYDVVLAYDQTDGKPDWPYASKVAIWEDNGEPMSILFTEDIGIHFLYISYKEMMEKGLYTKYIFKYEPFTPVWNLKM